MKSHEFISETTSSGGIAVGAIGGLGMQSRYGDPSIYSNEPKKKKKKRTTEDDKYMNSKKDV